MHDALVTDVKSTADGGPDAGSVDSGTAWRRIADELAAAIGKSEYAAGDTLPAATALAERYGVHRHTVRQAFRHLAEQGLVTVSRGRGTQVSARRVPYPLGRRVSLRANLGRIGLVGSSEMLSAAQIDGEGETCAALGLEDGARLWRIEGLSRADGTPMGTGTHWLSVTRFPGFDDVFRDAGASFTAAMKAYGITDYVRLSTRLTARLASEREADLLQIEPGAPVMVSLAVDALPDLTPIHLVSSVFAGERMEMVVEPFAE